jgi:murein DD-endopeptidase MepM/ murein hydrolase activator NlpD
VPDPPPPISVEPVSFGSSPLGFTSNHLALSPVPFKSFATPPLPAGNPELDWYPRRPLQGTVVVIRFQRAPGDSDSGSVRMELAGREVRLARTPGGWIGLAALPIDSAGPLELVARYGIRSLEYKREVLVLAGARDYPATRLRVAARGEGRPEVDARIREERALIQSTLREWTAEWLATEPFNWPRPPELTSPFGQRRVFNGVTQSRHLGLDIRGRRGTPVYAPAAGRVALLGDFFYQGNAVYLDHGLGLVTAYFHLSAVDVRQGDLVEPGQLLGRVGTTGRSTAPHLHWSAYVSGQNVDPASLIGLELGGLR